MFQERTGAKDDSRQDLFYVALILALIVFAKNILTLIKLLPAPWSVVARILAVLGLALLFYLFFTRRIIDYRYTVSCCRDEQGDGEEGGRAPTYADGTVLFERMVANKDRLVEKVEPGEFVVLTAPGEALPEGLAARDIVRCSAKSANKSHLLVYRREDQLRAVRFSPTPAMAERVREAIAANAAR